METMSSSSSMSSWRRTTIMLWWRSSWMLCDVFHYDFHFQMNLQWGERVSEGNMMAQTRFACGLKSGSRLNAFLELTSEFLSSIAIRSLQAFSEPSAERNDTHRFPEWAISLNVCRLIVPSRAIFALTKCCPQSSSFLFLNRSSCVSLRLCPSSAVT